MAVAITTVTDKLSNIENVKGTILNDTLSGDDRGNKLWGLSGDDVLLGLGGDDVLVSGAGIDTLDGGEGIVSIRIFPHACARGNKGEPSGPVPRHGLSHSLRGAAFRP